MSILLIYLTLPAGGSHSYKLWMGTTYLRLKFLHKTYKLFKHKFLNLFIIFFINKNTKHKLYKLSEKTIEHIYKHLFYRLDRTT